MPEAAWGGTSRPERRPDFLSLGHRARDGVRKEIATAEFRASLADRNCFYTCARNRGLVRAVRSARTSERPWF